MLLVHFQGKPLNITVTQVYTPTTDAEEAEVEQFYEDLQDLLELTPKKDVLFIIGYWNAKVGSQEIPGVTGKFGQVWPWNRTEIIPLLFKIAPKSCILGSFIDYEGYSISSKGFLPTVEDIVVIRINLPIPVHFSSLIPKILMFTLAISF